MSGVQTQFVQDGDKLHVNRVQDCEPIIEAVKAIREQQVSKEMRHVARIPSVIVEAYINRVGITFRDFMQDPAHIQRLLDDPDLRHFRTNPV